jgi:hypothetical protein
MRPACSCRVKTGAKETVITSRAKKIVGPTSLAASMMIGLRRHRRVPLQLFMGVLHHDDGRIDHGADGDGDAAEAHDVETDPLQIHDDEGHQDRHRQRQNDDKAALGRWKQKEDNHQGNDNTLFNQLVLAGF